MDELARIIAEILGAVGAYIIGRWRRRGSDR